MLKRIVLIILSTIVGLFIIYNGVCIISIMDPSNPNRDLDLAEYKATFRITRHLSEMPKTDNICHIEISGVINLNKYDEMDNGIAVYNTTDNIKRINQYLKQIRLVTAFEDELINQSADVFVTYYDNGGNILKAYSIYGGAFIRDCHTGTLYRVKNPYNKGIIHGLEQLFL